MAPDESGKARDDYDAHLRRYFPEWSDRKREDELNLWDRRRREGTLWDLALEIDTVYLVEGIREYQVNPASDEPIIFEMRHRGRTYRAIIAGQGLRGGPQILVGLSLLDPKPQPGKIDPVAAWGPQAFDNIDSAVVAALLGVIAQVIVTPAWICLPSPPIQAPISPALRRHEGSRSTQWPARDSRT
jgi:hypothetical protein